MTKEHIKIYFGCLPPLKQNKSHIRRAIRRLYKQNKRCSYCNRKTFISDESNNGKYNPFIATIDHIYDRYDIRRFLSNDYVFSCMECNRDKASKRNKELAQKQEKVNIKILLHG